MHLPDDKIMAEHSHILNLEQSENIVIGVFIKMGNVVNFISLRLVSFRCFGFYHLPNKTKLEQDSRAQGSLCYLVDFAFLKYV